MGDFDGTELTLADLTGRAAQAAGGRIAILSAGSSQTYASLHDSARRAGSGLTGLGLGPGDRVAVLLPNCLEYLHAFYAIPMAGCIVVPISSFLAAPEVVTVLQDSRARCLVTTPRRLATLLAQAGALADLPTAVLVDVEPGARAEVPGSMRVVDWKDLTAAEGAGSAPGRPRPGDVAVLTYTSGTTGRMKGVMLSHANLLANARSCLEAVRLREGDRLLLFLPMFHSLTQLVCLVLPVMARLSIVLLPGVDRAAIGVAVRRHRPTIFLGVPAIYAAMAERPPGLLARWLNPVRLYICGGAPLPSQVLGRFESAWRRPLCEGYGLSEASPVVCFNPVDGVRKAGSVGLPLPGVEVRIAAEIGGWAASGEIGEIVVRGTNVMQGYHERPEETAAALKDGWLHTGDLGRLDDEGYLFIVGRRKEMLIYRGMNVYPREIEEVLCAHEAVAEAAVVGLDDAQRGEVPHAAVVLRPGAAVDERALRAHCGAHLARYKVPRSIRIVRDLPRNSTGKVMKDRVREAFAKDLPGDHPSGGS
ncbi:MAG: AMP-binding protein [Acidobacteria bacterium]|nr:AMP-binding protein [Acidobacteriota bacterium]